MSTINDFLLLGDINQDAESSEIREFLNKNGSIHIHKATKAWI